jgi:hypothetical protein
MNEKIIVKPLSGQEIIDAVVNQVSTELRTKLKRDCFLSSHLAYAGYRLELRGSLLIEFQNTTLKSNASLSTNVADGELIPGETQCEVAEVNLVKEPAPPNEVRVENDLPVPALKTNPQGKVEETRIKYAKAGKKLADAKAGK